MKKGEKVIRDEKKVRMGGMIRVLTPFDFDAIREQPKIYERKFLLDLMLHTGMRYVELQRFVKNVNSNNDVKWFDPERKLITLPSFATKTGKSRVVLLTPNFTTQLLQYIEIKGEIDIIAYQSMDDNLKRWAKKAEIKDPSIIAVKTFRKTWESWLVTADKNVLKILKSQGHTNSTALEHYITIGFTPEEIAEIVKRTEGWGE